jgi:hypothetical protein
MLHGTRSRRGFEIQETSQLVLLNSLFNELPCNQTYRPVQTQRMVYFDPSRRIGIFQLVEKAT